MIKKSIFILFLGITISTAFDISFSSSKLFPLWALIVGGIFAFTLGMGMGANDVSNAFGTSVGSKVLTLKKAYLLAIIFESLGSILVGYNVTDTVRKGVVDINVYIGYEKDLFFGQIGTLGGCTVWLFLATILNLPVSTTHSLIGATVGMSLVIKGFAGIEWNTIGNIALSWILSPILSGIISGILYIIVDHVVLRTSDPFKNGLKLLPIFYFCCISFNSFAVIYQGSKILHLSSLPIYLAIPVSLGIGFIAALIVKYILRPRILRWISNLEETKVEVDLQKNSVQVVIKDITIKSQPENNIKKEDNKTSFLKWFLPTPDRKLNEKTLKLFTTIQTFTACFAGFAHGANDVSNAIGPFSAMIGIYNDGNVLQKNEIPLYVLLFGVFAICIGLVLLGHKVIKTVGQKMSEINPCSGFTIEFGAAVTSLLASKAGLPISTTHCLVGSVVAVGMVRSRQGVDWKVFRNIALSWVVTLPAAGFASAIIVLIFRYFIF
ncbi:Phosphate transporter family-containing protein [Strongyloides ratti]|uniref:Phosphate transporter n=1 Tax=Strongyloides ratti TaxID=34506 RepID=A0A090KWL0_STRRB|nr:Phosphate transporter family-containing protein [Strongyloides ratti]CEF61801.1 Phosphate transporter family-containing protein [Strongyloides ratti]